MDEPRPSREELVKRLRDRKVFGKEYARIEQIKEQSANLMRRAKEGKLSPQEIAHFQKMEKDIDACGGDVAAYCSKLGMSPSAIAKVVEAGKLSQEGSVDTDKLITDVFKRR
jgi:hypothetical protein